MATRTFAVGDIHGDIEQLEILLSRLPPLTKEDTLVFVGDYLDRGPHAAEVVRRVRGLEQESPAKVVSLRGNHEDAWLRVIDEGFDAFVYPPANGCLATLRSFTGGAVPEPDERPASSEAKALFMGTFFPPDVVEWLRGQPYYYENEHAICVHAGLPDIDGEFVHPGRVLDPLMLLWLRTERFFREYRGKPVVVGHNATIDLPQELSSYTPDDPTDLFAGEAVYGLDTGCGNGGFLSAIELPAARVYESR